MIKARALVNGRDTMFFGLDAENLKRLLQNQPIMFDGMELGLPGLRFVILAGATLDDVREDLRAIGLRLPTEPTP